jgi:hypothetical protein
MLTELGCRPMPRMRQQSPRSLPQCLRQARLQPRNNPRQLELRPLRHHLAHPAQEQGGYLQVLVLDASPQRERPRLQARGLYRQRQDMESYHQAAIQLLRELERLWNGYC